SGAGGGAVRASPRAGGPRPAMGGGAPSAPPPVWFEEGVGGAPPSPGRSPPQSRAKREFPTAGGLVGVVASRILQGAKPSELPVMQPTRFELVINIKTAKVLGLAIPTTLLALVD